MNISDILDYISGKSPELAGNIQAWISESESNREEYYQIKELWARKTVEEHSSPDAVLKAIAGIEDRIRLRDEHKKHRSRLILAWSVAAALAFIIAAGTLNRYLPSLSPVELTNTTAEVSKYTLPDGTDVFLRRNASLTYGRKYGTGSRNIRLVGEAYFNVRKDSLHPFVVHTPCASVCVLGTSFNVNAGESTDVILETGRVSINDAKGHLLAMLSPGDRATVSKEGNFTLEQVKTGKYTSWRYDYQIFDNCTFDEFVILIEGRYDVRFVYDPLKFRDTNFRLALSDYDTLDEILEMMDFIAHVKYEVRGRNIYIDKR